MYQNLDSQSLRKLLRRMQSIYETDLFHLQINSQQSDYTSHTNLLAAVLLIKAFPFAAKISIGATIRISMPSFKYFRKNSSMYRF
jgi:hypothetical protein